MSATQQVITIDDISAENAPTIFVAGGLSRFVEMVKEEVCGEVPDLKTVKGRDRIASLSAKVSKRKKEVENPGRDYLRHIKALPKVVEDELREFVTAMNSLRDEIRKPLTEWEKANDARIDRHNDHIAQLKQTNTEGMSASLIGAMIQDLDSCEIGAEYEEFEEEAHRAKAASLVVLRAALAKQEKYEADQAELERLRVQAEAHAEQERIRLAQEAAVEIERQRVAQEQQAEREAAAKREQALKDQAAAQERAAENQRLQLQLQAEQAERAAAQAKADQVAAEQRAEQERFAAIQRAEQAAEKARLAEIARANAAADELNRQAAAREADKAHKMKINRAALDAFVAGGMPEECAKQAVILIAQRKIPSVSISY